MIMKYLKSVDSYWDESSGLVYRCKSKQCRDTDEGLPIKEMKEDWWNRLSQWDISRIDSNGSLY